MSPASKPVEDDGAHHLIPHPPPGVTKWTRYEEQIWVARIRLLNYALPLQPWEIEPVPVEDRGEDGWIEYAAFTNDKHLLAA